MKKTSGYSKFILLFLSVLLFSFFSCKKETNTPITIDMNFPNGGEMLWKGNVYTIQWNYITASVVNIELYNSGEPVTIIQNQLDNTGSYDWLIPQDLGSGYDYKIILKSADNQNLICESKNDFIVIDPPQTSSFSDPRDGQVYKTVKLGEQWWLAQNFNYYVSETGSVCYLDVPLNCNKKGKLYTQEAAIACTPDGWHLPSDSEWKQLEAFLGMPQHLIQQDGLRGTSVGDLLWAGGGSGFDAVTAGYYNEMFGLFGHIEYETRFWSSSKVADDGTYWVRLINISKAGIDRHPQGQYFGCSVRLVKDAE